MAHEDDKNNPNPNPNPEQGNEGDAGNKFKEIKERYENEISEKDKEIADLKEQLKKKDSEIDDTLKDLNSEVDEKIKQSEEYKKLLSTVAELEKDKAEATVDKFIQQGKILPAQKETALKLCLSDNDTFLELYENAKPIVEIGRQDSKPIPSEFRGKLASYFR